MISVFICEDNAVQRKQLEAVVYSYIVAKDCDLEVALSTSDPIKLLTHLEQNPKQNSLYILDVDLQHEIDGIVLASKIREHDIHGKVVFVTAHDELSYLTFRYKVEALDYIIKDDSGNTVKKLWECLDFVYDKYQNNAHSLSFQKNDFYQVKTNFGVRNIPIDEVLFFESSKISHKLILHTKTSRIEFYGTLSDVINAHPNLYRSHKSFVINVKNIRAIYKSEQQVEMVNGEVALVTVKKIKGLLDAMDAAENPKR